MCARSRLESEFGAESARICRADQVREEAESEKGLRDRAKGSPPWEWRRWNSDGRFQRTLSRRGVRESGPAG